MLLMERKSKNMAYSEKAKALRRCKALRKDGKPCKAWAVWGEDFCMAHSGRHHQGPMPNPPAFLTRQYKNRTPPCRCNAYNWPHRPGGGLCNWPDPPTWHCTIPASTHAWPRLHR